MQKFINAKLKILKTRLKPIIIFSIVYLVGLIIGLFFSKKQYFSPFYANAYNYHVLIFDVSISPIKSVLNCLLTGSLLSITVFAFGFSIFTIPLEGLVIFYRGIVVGSAGAIFFSLSGFSGIITFILLTLPCHLLITVGLIVASVLNYDCSPKDKKTVAVFKNALLSLAFTLVATLYLFLILITVIRPINMIF